MKMKNNSNTDFVSLKKININKSLLIKSLIIS